ncbi:MAG TPA: IS110 family transposase [Longimicrobiales bacterium]|nr:IS110 family transposase [Longimicrobiales bacterium]
MNISEWETLLELLLPYRPLEVVVESSPFWPWLHDVLTADGVGFTLAHAKELRAIAHAEQKNDRVDALLLARMLQGRLIPRAYPRPSAQRERARLVRHRATLIRQRSRLLHRIHSQLHAGGLSYARGKLNTREGHRWLRQEATLYLELEKRRLVDTHLELIRALQPLIRSLDRRIAREADRDPAVGLLRSIPGIGPYRGMLLAAEILPIQRFATPAHLVSYAGLAPRTRSSGDKTRHGRIPAGCNRWLRGAFVRAALSHRQQAPSSPVSQSYDRLKERVGWQTARVATARKLCRIAYAMLRTGELWRGAEPEPSTSADGTSSPDNMRPRAPAPI